MAFANLTANLNLNIANFSAKLSQASKQMRSFALQTYESYGGAAAALNKHNLQLKDTVRIVHGIVIAQTFYQAAGAIRDATRSLWDFNVALDYMQVTYSALFGSTKTASDFMSVLQEHSVETIFDYQSLADASKKLLAYGIEYENLMFIMEGLTNLGAMSGDSAALDRIALALGQIYTKGKLSAEEMRQLANAYIPITEILQTKFGLTGDDLKRVGDLGLPAADVINAIVDYANENFASVGDAAMYTITGLQNRIVDTLKVVGAQMLKPITAAYKSFLAYISGGLETLRREFEAGGVGGIFEYLVPDKHTQQTIRQFIANVKNLFMSLMSVGAVAGQVFGNFATVFMTAFNIATPLIVTFVNALSAMLNAMLETSTGATILRVALVAAAGAFVVLRVHAVAALVITAVTKAVYGLAKALLLLASLITKHPILALLAGLAITLVGVSTASKSANNAISGLFDTISGAGTGASSGDVLQKVEQGLSDSSSAADQFNNRLKNAEESAKDLSKAIGGTGSAADKAAKKAAGLLSFDEVFKLNDPSSSSSGSGGSGGSGIGGGLLGDLENLAAGFGGLGDALIPDIPDFTEFIDGFTDGLFGGLSDSVVEKLKSIGIGALIGSVLGAIIGGILGGPAGATLGAKIGAFAGGIASIIWEELEGALNNTAAGGIAGAVTAIGKALTKAGSTVGLGALLKNAFSAGGIKGAFTALGGALKTAGLKSILKGGAIGAAVGLVVDGIAHLLWGTLEDKISGTSADTAKIGQSIAGVIGTIIGGILGGPAGAIIGSAIGTVVGGFAGLFWSDITEAFKSVPTSVIAGIGGLLGAIPGFLVASILAGRYSEEINAWFNGLTGDISASLTTWWEYTRSGFTTWWSDTKSGFTAWWADTSSGFTTWLENTISGFSAWIEDTKISLTTWWDNTTTIFSDWDSINSDTLKTWWSDTTSGFSTWFNETKTGLASWKEETVSKLTTWWQSTTSGFNTWRTNTHSSLSTWWQNTTAGFVTWIADIKQRISQWVTDTILKFVTWAVETQNKISTWVSDTKQRIANWATNVGTVIAGFALSAILAIAEWANKTYTEFTTWCSNVRSKLDTWFKGLKKDVSDWLDKYIWKPIADFFNVENFWNKMSSMLDGIRNKMQSWWNGIKSIFSGEVTVSPSVNVSGNTSSPARRSSTSLLEHATGGIFNREHIARFAEGNKAEAIIPLENSSAMQPFVDAVAGGITSYLAPLVAGASGSNNNNLPPLYVGTLIADDRGLKELYRKFEIIQLQENERRGTYNTPVLA